MGSISYLRFAGLFFLVVLVVAPLAQAEETDTSVVAVMRGGGFSITPRGEAMLGKELMAVADSVLAVNRNLYLGQVLDLVLTAIGKDRFDRLAVAQGMPPENLKILLGDYITKVQVAKRDQGGWLTVLHGDGWITTARGDSVLGDLRETTERVMQKAEGTFDTTSIRLLYLVIEEVRASRFVVMAMTRKLSAEQLKALVMAYIDKMKLAQQGAAKSSMLLQ